MPAHAGQHAADSLEAVARAHGPGEPSDAILLWPPSLLALVRVRHQQSPACARLLEGTFVLGEPAWETRRGAVETDDPGELDG